MNLESAIPAFALECAELLDAMESALLRLEHDPADGDLINEVFRAAHTIKGSAGLFGFDAVVHFAHHVESALDRVRTGCIAIDEQVTALLLACGDHIRCLVRAATTSVALDAGSIAVGARLLARLAPLLGERTDAPEGATPHGGSASVAPDASEAGLPRWSIHLGFGREVLRNGMDPLAFLRYLTRLGDILDLATSADALPQAQEVDAECCYLTFDVSFASSASQSEIEKVFEFVRDDCELRVERQPGFTDPCPELASVVDAAAPSATTGQLDRKAPASPKAAAAEPPGGAESARGIEPARGTEPKAREGRLIRVDADKLDQLIDLVGELVIAGAGSRLHSERTGVSALIEAATSVSRLVEEVRNAALGLRMVQIGATFQRFQRVVRDVSHELGKDIELVIEGAETELDKSLVEKLGDPLLHLVRNAIDHGIESVEARRQAGKAERGRLHLNAYHDSGSVVVEVADDGGGLRRERILQKAVERGLVSPEQTLSDHEVFDLIFEAGFSTADAVSNLSGRGVGMDVVRRSIKALRGTVELESQPQRGTTVRIRMPLTLAIIDGFLVRSGPVYYVIPLEMVVECLGFAEGVRRSEKERGFISVRDQALPIVRLAEAFGLPGGNGPRENIVVVKAGAQAAGLIVDELLGELQTVIKPLGKLFSHVRGISGSALLGSGDVALILDVAAVVQNLARGSDKGAQRRSSSLSPEQDRVSH